MLKNALVCSLLAMGPLSALPLRNVIVPPQQEQCVLPEPPVKRRFGVESDLVFQSHFQIAQDDNFARIEHTELFSHSAYVALVLFDRLSIFSTLGATRCRLLSSASTFAPNPIFGLGSGQRLEVTTETSFSWSVGARALLFEWKRNFLGIEGEYFSTDPNVHAVRLQTSATANPTGARLKYREGQFGCAVSRSIAGIAIPYLGVKWSFASMYFGGAEIVIPGTLPAPALVLQNSRSLWNLGYAVGITFCPAPFFDFTVEWRMNNEEALYMNGQLYF